MSQSISQRLNDVVDQLGVDGAKAYDIIQGPVGTIVTTDGGPVKSFATVVDEFGEVIGGEF